MTRQALKRSHPDNRDFFTDTLKDFEKGLFLVDGDKDEHDGDSKHVVWSITVALGCGDSLRIAGVRALSDPPRENSAALIAQLHGLGVRTVMVTGDSPVTARVVADAVGITGRSAFAELEKPAVGGHFSDY